jgi:hypothetical protein
LSSNSSCVMLLRLDASMASMNAIAPICGFSDCPSSRPRPRLRSRSRTHPVLPLICLVRLNTHQTGEIVSRLTLELRRRPEPTDIPDTNQSRRLTCFTSQRGLMPLTPRSRACSPD